MDPLHCCIAVVPLAAYLLLIGWINLRPRPFVTTGTRDLAALAIAVSGFAIVGPMELLLPETAAAIVGGWVWVPMILLYGLLVSLVLMMMRPSLILYNIAVDELRPTLESVLSQMDPQSHWAGDCVVAPHLGIQMAVETYPGVRNVMLTSVGPDQDLGTWHEVQMRLQTRLAGHHPHAPNLQGISYLVLSAALAVAVVYSLITGRQEIAQAFVDMLRL